jgi:hypothetical protein
VRAALRSNLLCFFRITSCVVGNREIAMWLGETSGFPVIRPERSSGQLMTRVCETISERVQDLA